MKLTMVVLTLEEMYPVLGDTGGSTIFVSGLRNDAVDTIKYVQTQISENHTYQYSVGINTHVPRSCLDLGGSASPLIMPSLEQRH